MQSAFIDIGLERAAFLHIVDVLEQRQNPDETQRIEHMLFEGQTVLVQVIKDPINSKGARLSTQISLVGRLRYRRKTNTRASRNGLKTKKSATACAAA